MSLPYELEGHAHDDAERLKGDIEALLARETERIGRLANWLRYKAFEDAFLEEMRSTELIDPYGKRDALKASLRTAWEKSQKP